MEYPTDFINQIICDNCENILPQIPDNSIDLLVIDAPYEFISKNPVGGGFMHKENKRHLQKINTSFGMTFDPTWLLKECLRICKKFNGYFFTNKSLLTKYIQFAEDNKFKWDILLWQKPNPVPINNGHYLIDKEYIVYIKEPGAYFNSKCGYEKYFTIKSYPIGTKITTHPTEKPLGIIQNLIEISSKEGDLVLDCYVGSGSSAFAARSLKRNFIGIDNNPDYVKMANDRLAQQILL